MIQPSSPWVLPRTGPWTCTYNPREELHTYGSIYRALFLKIKQELTTSIPPLNAFHCNKVKPRDRLALNIETSAFLTKALNLASLVCDSSLRWYGSLMFKPAWRVSFKLELASVVLCEAFSHIQVFVHVRRMCFMEHVCLSYFLISLFFHPGASFY